MIFYDFEVFKYDWLVVLINPINGEETIIVNSREQLAEFYNKHKSDIWVGYNSRAYDQWILKGILCGFDPKEINDFIIVKKHKGHEFSRLFYNYPLNNYDTMPAPPVSLKTLEAFMGVSIVETSVPFDIDRKLTQQELDETIFYCRHDVECTIEVFIQRKNEFDSQMNLIKTFGLPLSNIGKTQAQLAAIILGAHKKKFKDEWDIRIPSTLQLSKYQFIADWFMDKENHNSEKTLTAGVAGVLHVFAWGGVHGAIPQCVYTCREDEVLLMADVAQLYPSLMVEYDLLSRAVSDKNKFIGILDTSLRLKAEKKKKEREPYKRICNITYGSEGDKFNSMYDPLHRTLVCVFGQLLIVDLIEKVESICTLIQSNTDGILVLIKRNKLDMFYQIVSEWETRTRLKMEYDFYKTVIQKDVNNYLAIDERGEQKTKGAYLKAPSNLDYDLPIIKKALISYFVYGIPVEKTIGECNVLREFQKVVKVSSKYAFAMHNGKQLSEKTFRVFASTRPTDTRIGKCKSLGATNEKFGTTPDQCFIFNEAMDGVCCPPYLDRDWYIKEAKKRVKRFGI